MSETTYDSFGNVVEVGSDAAAQADPTGLAQQQLDLNNILSGTSDSINFTDVLKNLFGGKYGGTAGQAAAFTGLAALMNKLLSSKPDPVGYQHGVPRYSVSREQTPMSEQRPTTTGADGKPVAYRPGQGGITYFKPTRYSYEGYDPGKAEDFLRPVTSTTGGTTSGTTGGGTTGGTTGGSGGGINFIPDPNDVLLAQTTGSTGDAKQVASSAGNQTKYESPLNYGQYGFDQSLVDYLNREYQASASDAGIAWNYDPKTQMFSGGTMSGPVTATLAELQNKASGTQPGGSYVNSNYTGSTAKDTGKSGSVVSPYDTNFQYATGGYMPSGIAMLASGGNSARFLRGPGDGVSDSIHAKFDQSGQPARLADGEFVIDARTVSEIGNGSSEAGARKLYAMMDRVHKARKTAKRGKPSGADKFLPK